jgi:predicted nucleic acid-binding protein
VRRDRPRLHDATLRAPSLIGFEVANACLKKIRAAPAEREALIEAFSLLDALSISLETVNLDGAIVLAERMKLSLYDASYLWLAHARGAELVTLDDRLARTNICAAPNSEGLHRQANLACESPLGFFAPIIARQSPGSEGGSPEPASRPRHAATTSR